MKYVAIYGPDISKVCAAEQLRALDPSVVASTLPGGDVVLLGWRTDEGIARYWSFVRDASRRGSGLRISEFPFDTEEGA